MKRPAALVLAAVLLLAVVFGLRRCGGENAQTFQTAVVARGPITQAVSATGTLNPVVNVQVGSQVSGNIQKLFVDFNSPVKAGEIVAQIDPVVFQANVTQAEGDVASAKAALELARVSEGRIESLVAKQSSAQADLDQARASLHQAEANVQIKQGALDKVRADLEHATIRSPVDGVIISRSVDVGQTVAASLQAPVLFTIANDLTNMQIDANVAEADIGSVAIDQAVDFTVDAFPNHTFHGKVTQVRNAPINVQNVVSYDTVIGVSNPELKLKPGMTANVSIVAAHDENVLKISNAALRFRMADEKPAPARTGALPGGGKPGAGRSGGGNDAGGGSGRPQGENRATRTVYVLASGANEPKPTQIKTGISDGVFTEVLEGLQEGDRVVTAALTGEKAKAPSGNPFSGGGRRGF
ncbi:MAG: efflux RND transporter periplasmic adaptor subunit [Chthoniobacterales bacterium]